MELHYKLIDSNKITDEIAEGFKNLLVKQGKIVAPNITKIKSCFKIVVCFVDNKLIGIGALKPKTKSDFSSTKADLPKLEENFTWELGYFYVNDEYKNYGISSTITRLLLKEMTNENILASTELYSENPMKYVLKKFGFKQYGKPWLSQKHNGNLGLFLKFKKGELPNK
ncbi:GNAT family N-acetyltransferase [Flavobacterium taihuense]|uniref:N-acetyltransferase domain-containing protein n=1 Tax=Flavobacterium taihuense TaxID=2857508 RepID=A0ABS6Y1L9_9FLAO|nr:GNAT family N-acetyltransferase [Flavobacterium taihuense]MBW4362777.1 hypothetical protein [Flavobacterium taihuense]